MSDDRSSVAACTIKEKITLKIWRGMKKKKRSRVLGKLNAPGENQNLNSLAGFTSKNGLASWDLNHEGNANGLSNHYRDLWYFSPFWVMLTRRHAEVVANDDGLATQFQHVATDPLNVGAMDEHFFGTTIALSNLGGANWTDCVGMSTYADWRHHQRKGGQYWRNQSYDKCSSKKGSLLRAHPHEFGRPGPPYKTNKTIEVDTGRSLHTCGSLPLTPTFIQELRTPMFHGAIPPLFLRKVGDYHNSSHAALKDVWTMIVGGDHD
jgi:hypothetical protein